MTNKEKLDDVEHWKRDIKIVYKKGYDTKEMKEYLWAILDNKLQDLKDQFYEDGEPIHYETDCYVIDIDWVKA